MTAAPRHDCGEACACDKQGVDPKLFELEGRYGRLLAALEEAEKIRSELAAELWELRELVGQRADEFIVLRAAADRVYTRCLQDQKRTDDGFEEDLQDLGYALLKTRARAAAVADCEAGP